MTSIVGIKRELRTRTGYEMRSEYIKITMHRIPTGLGKPRKSWMFKSILSPGLEMEHVLIPESHGKSMIAEICYCMIIRSLNKGVFKRSLLTGSEIFFKFTIPNLYFFFSFLL